MPTTAPRRSLLGEKIGNYAILSTLGEGGMGTVYLAEHAILGKRAAIKVLHAEAAAEAAARCFVEARAAAAIDHPAVVGVIDCGVAELAGASAHYLVMEHLEGRSLRDELAGGALASARAIAIAIEVGGALAAAHARGILHRDIKPENIFVLAPGAAPRAGAGGPTVKVLDFGIAKLLDGHPFGGPLTRSGVALGTPAYMAPEQLDGEDVDARVDVYALGMVLFELLAGAPPFAGEPTARAVWRRMNEVPALPAGLALPPGVEGLLLRALDPDRVRRPSMAELVRGLADPAAAAAQEAAEGPHTQRVPRAQLVERAQPAAAAAPPSPSPSPSPVDASLQAVPAAAASRRARWPVLAAIGLVAGVGAAALVPRLLGGGDDRSAVVAPAAPSPALTGAAAPPPAPDVSPRLGAVPAPAAPTAPAPTAPAPRPRVLPPRSPPSAAQPPTTSAAITPDAGTPAAAPPPAVLPSTPPLDAAPTAPSGLGDNLMQPGARR